MSSLPISLFAAIALIPAIAGPLAGGEAESMLAIATCHGGSIVIPMNDPATPAPTAQPCCAKGCRGDNTRKRPAARNALPGG